MAAEPSETNTTFRLASGDVPENVICLKFGPDFLDELAGLAQSKQVFELVVVDCRLCGFSFQSEEVFEAGKIARRMLTVQGTLVFVKEDKATAIVRDSLAGSLTMHIFDTMQELYDYSPNLSRLIQAALGKGQAPADENTDLYQQILMASVPVLTTFGIKLKAGVESSRKRNAVLAAIDSYTSISVICQKLQGQGRISHQEFMEELRSLEEVRAIFPIFPRIPFLVHCFRNRIPFKLSDYLINAKLVTQDQLDEMLFEQSNNRGRSRLNLGNLCVSKAYISTRALEIALEDQQFYGQASEAEKLKPVGNAPSSAPVTGESLVGHLGTTDPAGLLQSLATNRQTGVLSVEHHDRRFRAIFDNGRVTHAKVGKIKANDALVEFASSWREGIFVFMQRQPAPDLAHESCQLTKPLDKLLLDAALAQDNIQLVVKKLPKGVSTPLEKLPDIDDVWAQTLVDPQEKRPLTGEELTVMQRLWQSLDGLTPLATTVKNLGDITLYQAAMAIDRLLSYKLVSIPAMDIAGPLDKFRHIAQAVGEKIGAERNVALLRLSLRDTQGYSVRARMFSIGTTGEIGVDLAAARSAGTSLSMVLRDLENWQVKYIEYVSQEMDRDALRQIVYRFYQRP